MTVHIEPARLAEDLATPICPAERIGREIAAIDRALREIDGRGPGDLSASERQIEKQLCDRLEHLHASLEWVRPASLAGAYVQLMHLHRLAQQMAEEDEPVERGRLLRRFERLNALGLEAFEGAAQITGDDLGKRDLFLRPRGLAEALGGSRD